MMERKKFLITLNSPYEHFDIPNCKISNLYYVSTEILRKYLDISKIELEEFSFTYLTIFDFLSNHSCGDFYCMKEVIIPYLLEILESKKEKAVIKVIAYLLQMNNNKSSFINKFIESKFY